MRIALVHDYLSQDGGAERVLKAMHELWPEAPIFVLFHDHDRIPYFNRERVSESFLAKLPWIKTAYQWYLPWMPQATENYDLRAFDVVISSSSVFAKGVITGPNTLHICYCHTPPRFLWADTHKYVADLKYNFFIKSFLPGIIHRMRLWDKMSADRVDQLSPIPKLFRNASLSIIAATAMLFIRRWKRKNFLPPPNWEIIIWPGDDSCLTKDWTWR